MACATIARSPGVTFEERHERRRDLAVVRAHRRRGRRAVPGGQLSGGPRLRLVEMTQVARGQPPGVEAGLHRRTADLVAANRLQQAVGRERHVTVVAGAPGRIRRVMRVRGDVVLERAVALKTRAVPFGAWLQLIVGPGVRRASIVRLLVHRVTGQARQRMGIIRGVPVARRVDQPVVLAAGRPDHAVGPEDIGDEIRIVLEKRAA